MLNLIINISYSQNSKIDSLLNVLKILKEDSNKVNTLNKLGVEYLKIGEPLVSQNYITDAFDLAQKINFQKGIATAYYTSGIINENNGNYQVAVKYYYKALNIYKELNLKKETAGIFNNVGNIYLKLGEYGKAWKHYYKSQVIREETDDKIGMAISYNNIGLVYWNQGNYSKALDYYFKSLNIKEELKDKKGIAATIENIGLIYSVQKNYEKALEYYFMALKIKNEINDKYGIAKSYTNIGQIYGDQENYTKALEYYQNSLKISSELDDKLEIARSYNNIGENFNMQKQKKKALIYFTKALEMRENIDDKRGIASTCNNIGMLYFETGKNQLAINYCKRALEIAKNIGELDLTKDIYYNLSEIYANTGDINDAFNNYKLYTFIKDSIFNEEGHKQIAEIQTKYETEKKEKEIELLTKDKSITEYKIRRQKTLFILMVIIILFISILIYSYIRNRELKKRSFLEQELNKYMQKTLSQQMNPHFIFNTINSIQYYIIKNDKEVSSRYLTIFAKLLRAVLENSQYHTVPIKDELYALELYLEVESFRFSNEFHYSINVDNAIDTSEYKIPTLLIQPYVENAIIHGLMPKDNTSGRIDIGLKKEENIIVCTIEDNGVGREKANEIKMSRLVKHKSLGTKITEARLDLINALYKNNFAVETIDLEDNDGSAKGTKIILKIPLIK